MIELFQSLNIVRNLDTVIENWNYQKLDEAHKISNLIKDKYNNYDFS